MTTETPWIRYDWPPGGDDPFDASLPEPLWLLCDGAGRWGRAWPAGDRRDFGGWGDFEQRVPMGYKVVQIRERVALVAGGEVVHRSARSETATWRGTWGAVGHLPYGAYPQAGSTSRSDAPTGAEALDAAVRFSAAEPDVVWMVSRRIEIVNWH